VRTTSTVSAMESVEDDVTVAPPAVSIAVATIETAEGAGGEGGDDASRVSVLERKMVTSSVSSRRCSFFGCALPVSRRLVLTVTSAVQVTVVVSVLLHAEELSARAAIESSAPWEVSVTCTLNALLSVVVTVMSAVCRSSSSRRPVTELKAASTKAVCSELEHTPPVHKLAAETSKPTVCLTWYGGGEGGGIGEGDGGGGGSGGEGIDGVHSSQPSQLMNAHFFSQPAGCFAHQDMQCPSNGGEGGGEGSGEGGDDGGGDGDPDGGGGDGDADGGGGE